MASNFIREDQIGQAASRASFCGAIETRFHGPAIDHLADPQSFVEPSPSAKVHWSAVV
jgi:hypothetical protein